MKYRVVELNSGKFKIQFSFDDEFNWLDSLPLVILDDKEYAIAIYETLVANKHGWQVKQVVWP